MERLKDRTKSCIPLPKPPNEQVNYKIKRILKEIKQQGWTTKQVNEVIIKEGDVQYYYTHIYRILHKWLFKQKRYKKSTCKHCCIPRIEEPFQKRTATEIPVMDKIREKDFKIISLWLNHSSFMIL